MDGGAVRPSPAVVLKCADCGARNVFQLDATEQQIKCGAVRRETGAFCQSRWFSKVRPKDAAPVTLR